MKGVVVLVVCSRSISLFVVFGPPKMDETLRRVGVLLDAQKKENNVSIPNGQGRRQQKGKDGEQKGSQTR